jgi:hypothetical protein
MLAKDQGQFNIISLNTHSNAEVSMISEFRHANLPLSGKINNEN